MKSLRAQLMLFWVILLTVCVALALFPLGLARDCAGSGDGLQADVHATGEGSRVTRDLLAAGRARIAEIAPIAAPTQIPQTDVVHTSPGTIDAQRSLRFALGGGARFELELPWRAC